MIDQPPKNTDPDSAAEREDAPAATGLAGRRRMWRRVAIGLAAATAVVVLLLGGLVLRLSYGPLSVAFLTPQIVDAVQAQLPAGYTLRLGDTVIERDDETGDVLLRLRNVAVLGADGAPVFAAARAAIGLSGTSLLVGRIAPRSVWVIQPKVTLVDDGTGLRLRTGQEGEPARQALREDEVLDDPVAPNAADGGVNPQDALAVLFAMLSDGSGETGIGQGLRSIGARKARITVLHADGTTGRLDDVEFGLYRGREDGHVSFSARLGGAQSARKSDTPVIEGDLRREASGFSVEIRLADLSAETLSPLLRDGLPVVMTGPISGRLSGALNAFGQVDRVGVDLKVGAGYLGGGERKVLVDEIDLVADYSHRTGLITLERASLLMGESGGRVSGQISVPGRGDFSYGTVPLRLHFADIVMADPDTGIPAGYDSALLEAYYVVEQKALHIARLDVTGAGTAGAFVGGMFFGAESPGVVLAGSVTPTSVDQLKRVWPPFLADKARRWFVGHVLEGEIDDARFNVQVAPGDIAAALRKVPLPQDSFRIDFRINDGVMRFLKQMPPVHDVNLIGRIDALEFEATTDGTARIDLPDGRRVDVSAGHFFVPDIPAKPSTGDFTVRLEGTVTDVVDLLDYPPIELARRRDLDPDALGGAGHVDFALSMPLVEGLRFSDIDLKADGEITGFSAAEFAGARNIEDGNISLSVADNRVAIGGDALVEGVRADLSFEEPLDDSGAPGAQSVTMTLDAAARERMGMPLGSILSGPLTLTVSDVRATPEGTVQTIEADLTASHISFPPLGLDKPAGEAASASLSMMRSGDAVTLKDLKIAADSMRVQGEAVFGKDGELIRVSLPVLRTPRGTDVTVSGRTVSGRQTLSLTGKSLDLRNALKGVGQGDGDQSESDQSGSASARMAITIDIDEAIGAGGVVLRDVEGSMVRAGPLTERLDLSATTQAGAPVSVRYSDSGANADLAIETSDAGGVLAWTGFYRHLRDGQLRLAAVRRGAGAPMSGSIAIDRFRVAGDPSLTQLIADGEEETSRTPTPQARRGGTAEREPGVQSGGGPTSINATDVGFDRLTANFERDAAQLRVIDGVLRGPAVGATIEGDVDFASQRLALHGTYVPLYALNNLFGQLPLFLGPLLGGKKNEGLLGITYSLSGSASAPVLTINPISVVAPGVFRYILGMDNPRAASGTARPQNLDPSAPIR